MGVPVLKPSQIHGFSFAVEPVSILKTDFANFPNRSQKMESAKDCRSCHATIYENWFSSRHRSSFSNSLYQESHSRENMDWCVNCHAPLVKFENKSVRWKPEEGISCQVCHVREGKIITSKLPEPKMSKDSSLAKLSHDYSIDKEFGKSEFCANCHQFNFPISKTGTRKGNPVQYSELPMQNTYQEWKTSSFHGKLECQSCHLRAKSAESHLFPGGHNQNFLKNSFRVEARRLEGNAIGVSIFTIGVSHSFPTGDLFRTLRLELKDNRGGYLKQFRFQKNFSNVPENLVTPSSPGKFLKNDSVIPPPKGMEYASQKELVLFVPENTKSIQFELWLDYLNESNQLTTNLPIREVQLLIQKGTILVPPIDEELK